MGTIWATQRARTAREADRWRRAGWDDPAVAARWYSVDAAIASPSSCEIPESEMLDPETLDRLGRRGYDADQVQRVRHYVRRHVAAWTEAMLGTERPVHEEPHAALARLVLADVPTGQPAAS